MEEGDGGWGLGVGVEDGGMGGDRGWMGMMEHVCLLTPEISMFVMIPTSRCFRGLKPPT